MVLVVALPSGLTGRPFVVAAYTDWRQVGGKAEVIASAFLLLVTALPRMLVSITDEDPSSGAAVARHSYAATTRCRIP